MDAHGVRDLRAVLRTTMKRCNNDYNKTAKEGELNENMAKYELLKQEGRAKRGTFHTVHGDIQTPVFMNVEQ